MQGKIAFPGIHEVVRETLSKTPVRNPRSVGDILEVDRESRSLAREHPLAQLGSRRERSAMETSMANFARLLGYFRIPIVATLERPVDGKGSLPDALTKQLGDAAKLFEKDFFDLTKEKKIRDHLARLKKKQVIVAGCETDVP